MYYEVSRLVEMSEGTRALWDDAVSRVGYIDGVIPVQGYASPLALAIVTATRSAETSALFIAERL